VVKEIPALLRAEIGNNATGPTQEAETAAADWNRRPTIPMIRAAE
jgi:hypothetical protein